MVEDRFKKLSHNYEKLFTEVFAYQGLDYGKFEESILDQVNLHCHLMRNHEARAFPILDIGCGDGATLLPLVKQGYSDLTGVDLNARMLKVARKKLGSKVILIKADATNLPPRVHKRGFYIVTSAACIHNIPKSERTQFWSELNRLRPSYFISAEKIAEQDPEKHRALYDEEVKAIVEVFANRHGLKKTAEEWIKHYEYDEREKLTLDEVVASLPKYNVKTVSEMGMYKTIVAARKY